MIKAIILDDGQHFKQVIVEAGENYKCISLTYFLNLLCKHHNFDYQIRTAHLNDIKNEVEVKWFEILNNMIVHPPLSSVKCLRLFGNLMRL